MLPTWSTPGPPRQLEPLAAVLWPAGGVPPQEAAPEGAGPAAATRRYLALPCARDPRMLVPVDNRRAAARAARLFTPRHTTRDRARAWLLGAALRCGACRAFPGRLRVPGGIEDELTRLLDRELALAVRLGPARANRKPVLALLAPDGEPLGFAKLGVGGLTDALVGAESAALRRLSRAHLPGIAVPRVIHDGTWQGHPLLVQEPLEVPVRAGLPGSEQLLHGAARIAELSGVTSRPLHTSPYLRRLRERLDQLPPGSAEVALRESLAALPPVSLTFGAWHGDFTRWNVAATAQRMFVWDWERLGADVPVGFDVLHFSLTEAVRRDARAVLGWLDTAAELLGADELARLGVRRDDARVLMTLYLVDLGARYLADDQAAAGGRLGRLEQWLLPALARLRSPDITTAA